MMALEFLLMLLYFMSHFSPGVLVSTSSIYMLPAELCVLMHAYVNCGFEYLDFYFVYSWICQQARLFCRIPCEFYIHWSCFIVSCFIYGKIKYWLVTLGFIAKLVLGNVLKEGSTISVNPLVLCAWAGLLINAINSIPAGELDGGRISFAIWGRKVFLWSWIYFKTRTGERWTWLFLLMKVFFHVANKLLSPLKHLIFYGYSYVERIYW